MSSDDGTLADQKDVLQRLAALATDSGCPGIADETVGLAKRVQEGRFFVACVGQYKRGKSTLINTLVGSPVLPIGVAPVTSVVTVVRHGDHPAARVRLESGQCLEVDPQDIESYVSEERNPSNVKRVAGVEVFLPNRLLASGMCLVDTPGIGSVITANTEATRSFVPQIDAALVVLGADPPISEAELDLVGTLAQQVGHLVFVINKADRLEEAAVGEASRFTERVLETKLGRPVGRILIVSAVERQRLGKATRDWSVLEDRLESLATEAGRLTAAAESRGARRLALRLLHDLDEQIGAITRPIEDSEQRIATLRACVADAERSMGDLGALFAVGERRLAKQVEEQQERFLSGVLPVARDRLVRSLQESPDVPVGSFRKSALERAQQICSQALETWRREEQPAAEKRYVAAVGRFIELANGFLERLAADQRSFEGLSRTVASGDGFTAASHLTLTEMLTLTARSPFAWLSDSLLPSAWVRRRIESETLTYLQRLLETNSARLKNDLVEQIRASRVCLESEIRDQLHEVVLIAERALSRARLQLASGREATTATMRQLEGLRAQVAALVPS